MSFQSWWGQLVRNVFGTPKRTGSLGLEATRDFPAVDSGSPTRSVTGSTVSRIMVGVVSTVGNHREHNEDNFSVPGRPHVEHNQTTDTDLTSPVSLDVVDQWVTLVVADGMGGQLAGEKASLMAVEMLPKELNRRLASIEPEEKLAQRTIRDAVAEVNKEILAISHIGSEYSNMGTTVVLMVFRNDRIYVTGIGDSRAYRLRKNRIERLTKDHSLADALFEAGTITEAEVKNHKFKNVLYSYLGSKEARGGPEQVISLDVLPGDRFLLATDGLTGVVEDDQLAGIVSAGADPQRSAKAMVDLALDNLSRDNVTVMVIHVE